MTLRVLVVGDPYMPVSAYASALAGLDGRVELTTMQIDDVTLRAAGHRVRARAARVRG